MGVDKKASISLAGYEPRHVLCPRRYHRFGRLESSFSQLIPADKRDRVCQHCYGLIPLQPTATYERRVLTPDGKLCWLRRTDRALFDESGRPVEYQSFGEDITEHVELEETLLKAKEQAEAGPRKEEQQCQEEEAPK